jgi:hypothetical protein
MTTLEQAKIILILKKLRHNYYVAGKLIQAQVIETAIKKINKAIASLH